MKLLLLILLYTSGLQAIYTTSILDITKNESPFLEPIRENNLSKVNALIRAGHDVNRPGKQGQTPFMAAVYKGDVKIIKALFDAGGDLFSRDEWGNTPFMYAFFGAKEKKNILPYLLSLDAPLEEKNRDGLTPLMLATLNNHCHAVKTLLEAGAHIEARERFGNTPLLLAADNQNIEPAKRLIQWGANLEARNDCSFTPLMLAAIKNDTVMLKLLLSCGANRHARTTRVVAVQFNTTPPRTVRIPLGCTALDIARQFKQQYAINTLTES